jgi:hypothetical protein
MKPTNVSFNHKTMWTILPGQPMLGFQIINNEVLCEDDQWRRMYGIVIGLFFIKFEYANIIWK